MNTISTYSYALKYRLGKLAKLLRIALVVNAICTVDRSGKKYIESPYGSQPSTVVQTLTGTFSTAAFTITDDELSVTDEFIVGEHIYSHEAALSEFDIFESRTNEQINSVKTAIDKYVLNELCEGGNVKYTTPAGGFQTAANVGIILTNLLGKVTGYDTAFNNNYLVLENTDLAGLMQYFGSAGFNTADAWLKNGWVGNQMGIDFYIVRSGTFVDAAATTASGTKTWTNSNHRVFGIKGMATYAELPNLGGHDIEVAGKTGREIAMWGFCGFKQWVATRDLTVDITLG